MSNTLGAYNTIKDAAREVAGNWKQFGSFAWFDKPDDADNWAICYTSNRDSGLLEQCNEKCILEALDQYMEGDDPDVVEERHTHWAVGYVDGFRVRVYREGEISEAFRAYYALCQRMADYPVLDEEAYSEAGYNATIENIQQAYRSLPDEWDLPNGWECEVYSWFAGNDCSAIESDCTDQGGYPTDEQLTEAFEALGYKVVE